MTPDNVAAAAPPATSAGAAPVADPLPDVADVARTTPGDEDAPSVAEKREAHEAHEAREAK